MGVLLAIGLVLAAGIGAFYLYFRKQARYWKELGVPYVEPSFPMGNIGQTGMKKSIGEAMGDLYNQLPNERFMGILAIVRPNLFIRDPELIKQIFVKDFMHFHDRGIYLNEKDDPLQAHLFSIGGTRWKNLRAKLTPTFTSGKMKMMFPTLVECSKELIEVLKEPASKGQVIEVKDYAARFTTDIISSCAFGIQTNSLKNPDAIFRVMGRKIFEPSLSQVLQNMIAFFMPKLAEWVGAKNTSNDVTKFFLGAVKETMDYREQTNTTRNDFMQLLIQLKNRGKLDDDDDDDDEGKLKDDAPVNDKTTSITFLEAAANAFIFFLAGFETSSSTTQFLLYELAVNPDIQEKTREEIRKVLAKHDNQMTYEAVHDMDYLQRVIEETLRKYPVVPTLQRECNKDYKLPGTDIIIPKGMAVQIPIYGLHNDPKHFPNPERFDPDRFTEEIKATRHHYAYLPFGEGPRNCIGMRFGLMQTKVGLITLLTNFRFHVAEETVIPIKFDTKSFLLTTEGKMNLRIATL